MSSFQAIVHSLMTPKFDSGCFNEDNVKKHRFQIQIYSGSIRFSYYKPNTIVKCKNSVWLWIEKTKYNRVKKQDFYYNVKPMICIIYKSYLSFIFVYVVDIKKDTTLHRIWYLFIYCFDYSVTVSSTCVSSATASSVTVSSTGTSSVATSSTTASSSTVSSASGFKFIVNSTF